MSMRCGQVCIAALPHGELKQIKDRSEICFQNGHPQTTDGRSRIKKSSRLPGRSQSSPICWASGKDPCCELGPFFVPKVSKPSTCKTFFLRTGMGHISGLIMFQCLVLCPHEFRSSASPFDSKIHEKPTSSGSRGIHL